MREKILRRLTLVRHAKAVEEEAAGDHARGLSPRGREDALALGAWLKNELTPQTVLCSTATRTRETLGLIAEGMGVNLPTILRDKLYLASAGELLAQIQATDDAIADLMVVAHNPGLHGLLALLVGDYVNESDADRVIMKFPTASAAILTVTLEHWKELRPQTAKLAQLRWPAEA